MTQHQLILNQGRAKAGNEKFSLTRLPSNCLKAKRKSVDMEALRPKPAEQHLIEMRSNREAWRRCPLLRVVYGHFYELIRENLAPVSGPIVELGSGIGAVKEFIPECVTSDIFPNPWLDRRENAYALNFPDESVSSLILLDVFPPSQISGNCAERVPKSTELQTGESSF